MPTLQNAIIKNADTKILLDLSKFSKMFNPIKSFLGLSDHEALQLLRLQLLSQNPSVPDQEFLGPLTCWSCGYEYKQVDDRSTGKCPECFTDCLPFEDD